MLKLKLCTKLIISGAFIERFEFKLPEKKVKVILTAEELAKKEELRKVFRFLDYQSDKITSSASRCKIRLRRLIHSNAGAWKDKLGKPIPARFLTLTFKENIQDLKSANQLLTKFIQRLNYRFLNVLIEPLVYVCVPEFQDRGAVHYHLVLFNFPFIHYVYKKLYDCWDNGRIKYDTIRNDANIPTIVGYITKYITKQAKDERFKGKKRYFASRTVKKSLIIRSDNLENDVAIELIRQRITGFKKYETSFNTPFCGNMKYCTYYLGDNKNIEFLNLDLYARNQIEIAKNPNIKIELIKKICNILSIAANRPNPKTGKLCPWTPKKKSSQQSLNGII